MKKVCLECGRVYEDDANFCSDDGGLVVPEDFKMKYVKNIEISEWIVNFLISVIPLVGLIFIVIWANDEKKMLRKNWAVAQLFWMGILFIFSILLWVFVFSIIKDSF
jgi:hypothetical protein